MYQLLAASFGTYPVRYFSQSVPSATLSQQLAVLGGNEFSKDNSVLDVAIGFIEFVVSYKNIPPHAISTCISPLLNRLISSSVDSYFYSEPTWLKRQHRNQ